MSRRRPATSPSARLTPYGSASEPTRRQPANTRAVSGFRAKKAAQRELLVTAQELSDRATDTRVDRWALRYLESSRLLVPPPAPLDSAEQRKLTQELADLVAEVIGSVLDGLGLSDAEWQRGRELALTALTAATQEGWEPQ